MAGLESLSREELIALILKQQQLIEELRVEIERLKRSQQRPAAPFSKGQRKAHPNLSGLGVNLDKGRSLVGRLPKGHPAKR
jgi:hypothetical protein